MPSEPRFPDVTVPLVGEDGNAFNILARVRLALLRFGVPTATVEVFLAEATADDYDHLLRVVQEWVEVE